MSRIWGNLEPNAIWW